MDSEEVKRLIEAGIPGAVAHVNGDGYQFEANVVSNVFDGLSMLKKQQLVYGTVQDQITSGALHALTINAYTPKEWQELNGRL